MRNECEVMTTRISERWKEKSRIVLKRSSPHLPSWHQVTLGRHSEPSGELDLGRWIHNQEAEYSQSSGTQEIRLRDSCIHKHQALA